MEKNNLNATTLDIPNGFIIFISGVPSMGKTTISYELLRKYRNFRIIEETDILRDSLRGYNELLKEKNKRLFDFFTKDIKIMDNTKPLTFNEAKQQCFIMKNSINNIVQRQQRRNISSIINGIHIIPEVLSELGANPNIIFINLYIQCEDTLRNRLENRDPTTYMLQHIPLVYQCNKDLYTSTEKLSKQYNNTFFNIDVTTLNLNETLTIIESLILKRFSFFEVS